MKASFNENNFSTFLSDLISGRSALEDLKGKITFKNADPWDGKDAKPLEEVSLLKIKLFVLKTLYFNRRHPLVLLKICEKMRHLLR
jgi:hypothetical protein